MKSLPRNDSHYPLFFRRKCSICKLKQIKKKFITCSNNLSQHYDKEFCTGHVLDEIDNINEIHQEEPQYEPQIIEDDFPDFIDDQQEYQQKIKMEENDIINDNNNNNNIPKIESNNQRRNQGNHNNNQEKNQYVKREEFQSLVGRVGNIEKRMDNIEKRMDNIEKRVGNLETQVSNMNKTMNGMNKNIIEILKKLK